MKKQRLTQEQKNILTRCKTVFKNWVKDDFEKECKRILINYDVKEINGNFADAYPIVAAVLLDNCVSMIGGYPKQKRLAHQYMQKYLDV